MVQRSISPYDRATGDVGKQRRNNRYASLPIYRCVILSKIIAGEIKISEAE